MRGWRRPEFAIGLDAAGRIALPVPTVGFAPEGVTIQQLSIEGGRAILTDAASGSRLVLDKFEFKGDVRSLAGPAKGEGSFVVAGQHYPYRFSASRLNDDGSIKVRLALDPIDRPFTAEADLSIRIENGVPQFEGVSGIRACGRARARRRAARSFSNPGASPARSRATATAQRSIRSSSSTDPTSVRSSCAAAPGWCSAPSRSSTASCPRRRSTSTASWRCPRRPAAARCRRSRCSRNTPRVRCACRSRSASACRSKRSRSPALRSSASAGSFKSDGETWEIERLELRAPGITQVRVGGRVGLTPSGAVFKGPLDVDANDPARLARLVDRPCRRAVGDRRPAARRRHADARQRPVAVEALKAEVDRMTVAGRSRLSLGRRSSSCPHRLARSPRREIDIDRIHALGKAMFDDGVVRLAARGRSVPQDRPRHDRRRRREAGRCRHADRRPRCRDRPFRRRRLRRCDARGEGPDRHRGGSRRMARSAST